MKIETKFDIGQEIWVIKRYKKQKNVFEEKEFYKIENYIIVQINIHIFSANFEKNESYYCNWYNIERNGLIEDFREEDLFATKEEAEKKLEEIKNDNA